MRFVLPACRLIALAVWLGMTCLQPGLLFSCSRHLGFTRFDGACAQVLAEIPAITVKRLKELQTWAEKSRTLEFLEPNERNLLIFFTGIRPRFSICSGI